MSHLSSQPSRSRAYSYHGQIEPELPDAPVFTAQPQSGLFLLPRSSLRSRRISSSSQPNRSRAYSLARAKDHEALSLFPSSQPWSTKAYSHQAGRPSALDSTFRLHSPTAVGLIPTGLFVAPGKVTCPSSQPNRSRAYSYRGIFFFADFRKLQRLFREVRLPKTFWADQFTTIPRKPAPMLIREVPGFFASQDRSKKSGGFVKVRYMQTVHRLALFLFPPHIIPRRRVGSGMPQEFLHQG